MQFRKYRQIKDFKQDYSLDQVAAPLVAWRLGPKRWRLPRRRMTIAIGQICRGGALVSADTRIVLTDGSATTGPKVTAFKGKSGVFAIADAADDANAAKTLIRRLTALLQRATVGDWDSLEDTVSRCMTRWAKAFSQHPNVQILLASFVAGSGVRLYLCEPPNTMLPKYGYVAAGSGAAVTDPIQKTLFGQEPAFAPYVDPQLALRNICYLMFRAKQDAALCGGKTDAVYIRTDGAEPEWVNRLDLEAAEKASYELDFFLAAAARFLLFSETENLEKNGKGLADMLTGLAAVRATVFHNIYGDVITPSAVQTSEGQP
jgi:20S proteasome alpha/beta subunit